MFTVNYELEDIVYTEAQSSRAAENVRLSAFVTEEIHSDESIQADSKAALILHISTSIKVLVFIRSVIRYVLRFSDGKKSVKYMKDEFHIKINIIYYIMKFTFRRL